MIPHSKPGETRATNRHHNFDFTPISINFAGDMPNVFHTLLPTIMAVATPCTAAAAEQADTAVTGSSSRVVHRVEADYATGGIFHTDSYLNGGNAERRIMNHASAVRLKYAFMAPVGSMQSRIYPGPTRAWAWASTASTRSWATPCRCSSSRGRA